ncbi:hypothetical protein [Agrobacterium pusense]|uniref:hypothetical protein n=1 Tax=Agrobacterium pusense TaxID=648995 RepID=UPI000A6E6868|nr:hypothetical protein [Agrobacterium pusense]QWW77666.1 hypothetical protein KP800_26420 [Agrobacterium pusense]
MADQRLASSDMVRKAAQRHERLQPIPDDDRIQSLLERLSEAEKRSSTSSAQDQNAQ